MSVTVEAYRMRPREWTSWCEILRVDTPSGWVGWWWWVAQWVGGTALTNPSL